MLVRTYFLTAALVSAFSFAQARAQETPPGARPPAPGRTAPAGPENKYSELTKSKDLKAKALAERYSTLVKFQEWGTLSGKSTMAKYVSHDADLSHVKLAVPKGTGKERTIQEYNVEVAKLNKTGQFRVKQIDLLQKKLDELAVTAATTGNGAGQQPPGGSPEGPGGTPPAEHNPTARNTPGPENPGPPPAQPAGPDPSASEPDPLGFAELPAVAAPAPGAASPANPLTAIRPANRAQDAAKADKTKWREDLNSFAANFQVTNDAAGKPQIDWGQLGELRKLNELVTAQRGPEPPAQSPESETPAAISSRLGEVHWQLAVAKTDQAPGGILVPIFAEPSLPKPLEMHIALDEAENVQQWSDIKSNDKVKVIGRITISEPNKITVKVRKEAAR
jgi:hypothetical protein